MAVHADLKDIMPMLTNANYAGPTREHEEWMMWSKVRQNSFSVVLDEYWENEKVNPYCFIKTLFDELPENQIVVAANATACITSFQAGEMKPGQRLWSNSGCATMGYDLPASIGAHKASNNSPIVCLAGDGSIMMNLQELQTIAGNQYPIKIFILNNSGYVSIFQTHRNFFGGVEVGGGPKSGVTFPNFSKISQAFDIPYQKITKHSDMKLAIEKTLSQPGPSICEVYLDENVVFAPKLGAKQHPDGRITSPPLEDLSPFLSRDVLRENMIIDSPIEE